ncbi:MAG TPA: lycopene cyclase domain-containing protein [Candidatus Dormibacteraeota bacterium]|jgi:lycopene cyclase domain-containing protein|nr:lycopene cyclase domain-containing protein [Candidatus Dormibacteraeota bacterium]
MEYTLAAVAALIAALGITVAGGGPRHTGLWLGLAIFAALTVAGDSLLIRLGVFGYADRYRSGIDVVAIPVEDLLYGCALYLIANTVWSWGGED